MHQQGQLIVNFAQANYYGIIGPQAYETRDASAVLAVVLGTFRKQIRESAQQRSCGDGDRFATKSHEPECLFGAEVLARSSGSGARGIPNSLRTCG